jgi:hypothetical protein
MNEERILIMADTPASVQAQLNAPDERTSAAALSAAVAPVAPPDPALFGVEGCCVREYWAVVERNGTLVRGRNVWRTKRLAQGQYEVVFTGDVSNGVYVATIGRPGIATEPAGEIGVALRCCLSTPETNKGVWIDTHDSNGAFSDRAFHVVAMT